MVSIYDALLGNYGDENDYLAKDPFFTSGVSLARTQFAPKTNTEAWLLPALQGGLSGLMIGYGRQSANDQAYSDYKTSPFLQALSARTDDPLHDYTGEDAPEGWTPKIGRGDLAAALMGQQIQQERAQKQLEGSLSLQKALADKGLITSPEGKVMAIPGFSEAEADQAAQVAKAKKIAEVQAENEAYGVTGSENPNSPVYKTIKDKEDTTYKRITDLPQYKQLADIEPNFKTAVELAKQDTKAADIGFISAVARIRDPNSTVREGEFHINENAQSWLDGMLGNWRKVLEGKSSLSPEVKSAVIGSVASKYNETGSSYMTEKGRLIDALKAQGGNPANIPTLEFNPYKQEVPKPDASQFSSFEAFKAAKDAWRAANGG